MLFAAIQGGIIGESFNLDGQGPFRDREVDSGACQCVDQAPTARPIVAWGIAPGKRLVILKQGLKARPIEGFCPLYGAGLQPLDKMGILFLGRRFACPRLR